MIDAKIRNYTDSDYEAVKETLEEARMYDPNWDSQEGLREKIRRNPEYVIVAEVDRQVIGNVIIIDGSWGGKFIYRLAVRKDYRKNGIGSMLLSEAEERIRKVGYKEVALFTYENNEELKEFYEKRGYILGEVYRSMHKVLKK